MLSMSPISAMTRRWLQRPGTDKSPIINKFNQVLSRHFFTMSLIAGICIIFSIESFVKSIYLQPLISSPFYYFITLCVMLLFFFFFYLNKGYEIERIHLAWLTYLLFISVVEEFAFRMMLPFFLIDSFGTISAIIFSNLLFACIHYVTLRWSLINCLIVFMGGLGLSRLLVNTEDITILILVHYFFTFLNTPLPPERRTYNRAY